MLAQGVSQSSGAPEEHSAVPEVVAGCDKLGGRFGVGFLSEAAHAQRSALVEAAGFDVPIAGFGASRADPEDHDVSPARCEFDSAFQRLAVSLLVGDY